MEYTVILLMDAVEDVPRLDVAGVSKTTIVAAAGRLQDALKVDPQGAGEHLSEGLYYIDCDPLRAFFTIDDAEMVVEIVNVRAV